MNIELHPLCTLFPRMSDAEFAALRADIAAHGQREPIMLLDGMVLDGGNRYRACVEEGVEPFCEDFPAGTDPVAYVLSANLHRRHLTPGQHAAIVASLTNWSESQGKGRPEKAGSAPLSTVAERAAASGASERTQRMADTVAKADPALAREVAQGTTTLPAAVAKVQGKAKPEAKPEAKPAAKQTGNVAGFSEKPAEQASDGPSLPELVDELQRENAELVGQLAAVGADDPKAEALKWRKAYDHAVRQQSEAMERAKEAADREAFTKRQLMRCGKAVGEDDPTRIAAAVEAVVRKASGKVPA